MKYFSEVTKELYDTPEACADAENKVMLARKEEEERKLRMQAEKEQLAKEIESELMAADELTCQSNEKWAHVDELISTYTKKFGPYRLTYKPKACSKDANTPRLLRFLRAF